MSNIKQNGGIDSKTHESTMPDELRKLLDETSKTNDDWLGEDDDVASIENTDKLIELFFSRRERLYEHNYESFHQFLEAYIPYTMKNNSVIQEYEENGYFHSVKCIFNNYRIRPPHIEGTDQYMTPIIARNEKKSYMGHIVIDIEQVDEITEIATGEKKLVRIGETEKNFAIKMPMMVNCRYCSTNIVPTLKADECKYDPGCYFIIKGSEKTIIMLEKKATNRIIIYDKASTSHEGGKMILGEVNSQADDLAGTIYMQMFKLFLKPGNGIMAQCPQFGEVPLVTLLRALGMITDKEIMQNIVMNKLDSDMEMTSMVYASLGMAVDDEGNTICTKEEAHNYLICRIDINKYGKAYNAGEDTEERMQQKRLHMQRLLDRDTLPHIRGSNVDKARFICLIAHKVLQCALKRREIDDRDAYINKIIETPGVLMAQLFRGYWARIMRENREFYKKQANKSSANVLHKLRHNIPILEQGIRSSLATGNWGSMGKVKKGVARTLERLNYLQAVSNFRRIKTPMVDENAKITSLRHIKSDQIGYVCVVETPEGASTGIIKNMSMSSTISNYESTSHWVVREKVTQESSFHPLEEVDIDSVGNDYVRVIVDGDWMGFTSDIEAMFNNLKSAKINSQISSTVGLELNVDEREFLITTCAGRMMRPLLTVNPKTMKTNLTTDMIESIDLTGKKRGKVKTWEEFIARYPGVMETVALEQQTCQLVASSRRDLQLARVIRDRKPKSDDVLNRYANTYAPYNYRELHYYLNTGITVANIPFMNHNQAPRNTYQFSQARAANGIYATNYRNRFDNSFHMYHPEIPVLYTKPMKYVGTADMASGQNCIVAIMPFTGYNQEDSVIMNASSVSRGMFVSTYFKKESAESEKNHATCQDDIFTKPDPEQVSGRRNVDYSKLNMDGYVEQETTIDPKSVIIGKISSVQVTSDNMKAYRDSSVVYKGPTKAVVDKVLTGIQNESGYDMIQMRIRAERKPIVGDKVSSRHGQKGTVGLLVRQEDMPVTSEGITPDIIINENCMPGRMTIGQLLETITGKIAALDGNYVDGTAFHDANPYYLTDKLDALIKGLGKSGFDKYGCEEMYSGMSGEKMQAKIFIGPNYYQRLKHQVHDKIHARPTGSKTMLTRQPPEGRQKDGGFRWGEMERDCGISHGLSMFLKERMVDCSDKYVCHVCNECGMLASKLRNRDVWYCKMCDTANTTATEMPYAFKLMTQELMAINIKMSLMHRNDFTFSSNKRGRSFSVSK